MYPKEFIHKVLVQQLSNLVPKHAYFVFSLISSGIEFLGKCIDCSVSNWEDGKSSDQFKCAIIKLFPDKYHPLVNDLYKGLRCGMVHRCAPGTGIALSENKNDLNGKITRENHLTYKNTKGQTIIIIEYFYQDFVEACKKVLAMDFPGDDKMNESFLEISNL